VLVPLVLASGSPRRKELLEQLGLEFQVCAAHIDESVKEGESPLDYVARLATQKVVAVGGQYPAAVVLAADTSVVVDSHILGKPGADAALGASMLEQLSGKAHVVMSGIAVKRGGQLETRVVSTVVVFRKLKPQDIRWYVATGEGCDKAGGYALQGKAAAFVQAINGSHTNVIGLPLIETLELLQLVGGTLPWSKFA
jgi:septum formation protein